MVRILFLNCFNLDLVFMIFMVLLGGFAILCFRAGLSLSTLVSFDHFSFTLALLTIVIFFLRVLCVFYEKVFSFFWSYLVVILSILLFALVALFLVNDVFSFYIFFELTVIPTFILIIGWGYSTNRLQASFYILIYTLIASYPFLYSFLRMYTAGVSIDFFYYFYSSNIFGVRGFWWVLYILVFATKLPVFFLHLWLPRAHVDAPLLGSMVLAGVLLKMGGYGLYRIRLFFFSMFLKYLWRFSVYCLLGSFLISLICLRQLDMRRIVAYSSVVHIGPVFCCFFLSSYFRVIGSFLIIFSHGICSCALFFYANLGYLWLKTRSLFIMRGGFLLRVGFFYLWCLFCFLNMGCPPSFNFFSELIVILSCLIFSRLLYLLFFLLLLFVGFYCIIIIVSVAHGGNVSSLLSLNAIKLSDYCASIIFSFILIVFIFIFFLFSC